MIRHALSRRRMVATMLGAAFALAAPMLHAQTYPARAVTLIVSFAPGGSTDISARAISQELSLQLQQPVVVENRSGAGGRVGTKYAAQAKPDGYTLLWAGGSSLTSAPVLYSDQEHVATLVPISLGATQPFVFAVSPALGIKTTQAFIDLAKRSPGTLNFATGGTGSSNHLLGEILMSVTGVQLVHVPYKGSAMARDALVRGEAHLMNEVTSTLIGALRAGQLVPLFTTGEKRDELLPDLPTAAEVGLPALTIQGFFGLLAPAGTPPQIVARLNEAMRVVLSSAQVAKVFGNLGFDAAYSTPEQMSARIAEGKVVYARIVKERQIRVE